MRIGFSKFEVIIMKRNLVRFFRSLCGAGGTFLIACAYGPVANEHAASGRVTYQGQSAGNLSVCAHIGETNWCTRSEADGTYRIDVDSDAIGAARQNGFSVCAEDDMAVFEPSPVRTCSDVLPNTALPAVVNIEMQEP